MDPRLHYLPLALVVGASCAGAVPDGPPRASSVDKGSEALDTTTIVRFWASLDRTWQRRDADAFAELFSEEASFVIVDRELWLEGRDEILTHFTDQFATQRPRLQHVTELGTIRVVAPRTVVLDGVVRILESPPDGVAPGVFRELLIAVIMTATDADWEIRILRAYTRPLSPRRGRGGRRLDHTRSHR